MSPARIALVIGQLSIGGAERQICELLRHLDRSRFEPRVYVLSGERCDLRGAAEQASAAVRVIGSDTGTRLLRLARALREDRVDLIHSWLFIANSYAWGARHLGIRAPLVSTIRNCKSQGRWHDLANRAAFAASRRVIVNSHQVGEYATRRFRLARRRVAVVYNGVDTNRFRRAEQRRPDARPTVITAGRFVEQKNPWLFLRAAELVHEMNPAVRFVMVGEGPLRAGIVDQARRSRMAGDVEFPGERSDMADLLRDADVFWLTSSWEGLPNVILEAMASGVPVVATDVGGTRELFQSGREGFLVRPGCADEIAFYTSALLRDAPRRAAMGAAARRRAEQFSLERMARETEAVYESAFSSRGGER